MNSQVEAGTARSGMRQFMAENRERHPHILLALEFYDHEIHRGVMQYARQAGWVLDNRLIYWGKLPACQRASGVIAIVANPGGHIARFLRQYRGPAVDLANEAPALRVPRVLADNPAIGRTAAEHLLERGFKHLAFCCLWDNAVERERMVGFRQAVEKAKRAFYLLDHAPKPHRPSHYIDRTLGHMDNGLLKELARHLQRLPRPLGVMGQCDIEALLVLQACQIAKLHVPEEVAVVGADNEPLCCESGPISLSSVERRRREHGYQGAALLDRLLRGETPPAAPILVTPGPVVIRQSSDLLAVEDPAVRQALRFIAEHYRDPGVQVADIVEGAGLGRQRRRLYRLFAREIGVPVKAQLLRHRISRARQLLLASQDKLHVIAHNAGFRDAEHLTRAFRRELGIAPGHLRAVAERAARG